MGRGNKNSKRSGKKLRTVGSHHHARSEGQQEGQDRSCDGHCVINIGDEGHTYDAWTSGTIYRVPNNLRGVRMKAFTPKIISIGPFHYREREKGLRVMEDHKKRFLKRVLGGKCERRKFDYLRAAMKNLEEETRACYSEPFPDIDEDDFVEMMVLDGCFVLELLRLHYDSTKSPGVASVEDSIFTTPWMLRTLQRDLLMLENQLPYFVLEKLFRLINENRNIHRQAVSLEELAVIFFGPLLPRKKAASTSNTAEDYNHLLSLFRSTFLNKVRNKVDEKGTARIKTLNPDGSAGTGVQEKQLIHFVSELQDAGVQFKKREGHDLLDIKFNRGTLFTRGTLSVPPLFIDDNTVPLFLNFIAYEQCHDRAKPFFTNYFMLWDSLVNSPGDIQILHNAGIINHVLGSNTRVADLLNNLCREIVYDLKHCYLKDTIEGLNDYCKPYDDSQWRQWYRNLIHERFSSPWTCLSLFAAIFLLLLTVLQTVYTLYPYYRPY